MATPGRLPLSTIMRDMAVTLLKNARATPSSEAFHAALLCAHVAWNRSLGERVEARDYARMLRVFERSKSDMWSELRSDDPETLIRELEPYRRQRHPDDARLILVCGMRPAGRETKIHVDWIDRDDRPAEHPPA